MSQPELFELVSQAKAGDKKALEGILNLFQPAIQKVCRRARLQERRDLEQHLNEKIIRAVFAYDMNSIPDYSRFIKVITDTDK